MNKEALFAGLGTALTSAGQEMQYQNRQDAAARRAASLAELKRKWQIEDREDEQQFRSTLAADQHEYTKERLGVQAEIDKPLTEARIGQAQSAAEANRARAGYYDARAMQGPEGGGGMDAFTDMFGQVDPASVTPEFMQSVRMGSPDPTLLKKKPDGEFNSEAFRRMMVEQSTEMIPTQTEWGGKVDDPVGAFIQQHGKDAEQAGITPDDSLTDARKKLAQHMIQGFTNPPPPPPPPPAGGGGLIDGPPQSSTTGPASSQAPEFPGIPPQYSMVAQAALEQLQKGRDPAQVRARMTQNGIPGEIADQILGLARRGP